MLCTARESLGRTRLSAVPISCANIIFRLHKFGGTLNPFTITIPRVFKLYYYELHERAWAHCAGVLHSLYSASHDISITWFSVGRKFL